MGSKHKGCYGLDFKRGAAATTVPDVCELPVTHALFCFQAQVMGSSHTPGTVVAAAPRLEVQSKTII